MSRTAQKKNHNLDRLVGTVRKVEAVQRMLKELLEEHPVTIVATESYKAAYEECREKVRKVSLARHFQFSHSSFCLLA